MVTSRVVVVSPARRVRGHLRRDFFERALRFLVVTFFFETFVAFAFFGATGAGSECEALVFRGALGLASWSI